MLGDGISAARHFRDVALNAAPGGDLRAGIPDMCVFIGAQPMQAEDGRLYCLAAGGMSGANTV